MLIFVLSLATGTLTNNPIRRITFTCHASLCRSTLAGNLLGCAKKLFIELEGEYTVLFLQVDFGVTTISDMFISAKSNARRHAFLLCYIFGLSVTSILSGSSLVSDEQMSKRWPFSVLNDEQMSNWAWG